MRNENFYTVQGWMRNELHLKGIELNIYAFLFSFCQYGATFSGSNSYIADSVGCSAGRASAAISSLQKTGLISIHFEHEKYSTQDFRFIRVNKVPFKIATENNGLPPSQNVKGSSQNVKGSSQNVKGSSQNVKTPFTKCEPIYIEDIDSNNNKDNTRKRFLKPTVQEIQDYAASQNLSIDAEQLFDHYESNGWRVGSHKMKDWKATVRNWARRSFGAKPQPTESFSEYDVTPDEVF